MTAGSAELADDKPKQKIPKELEESLMNLGAEWKKTLKAQAYSGERIFPIINESKIDLEAMQREMGGTSRCPKCGNDMLTYSEGCVTCHSCLWSRCE